MTHRLTLRARFTLAYTAIVAVAVALLGTVALIVVHLALDTAFQTRLETTAKAIRSIIDVRHGKLEELHGEDLIQFQALLGGGLNAAVLRRDRSVMSSNVVDPPRPLLADLAESVPAGHIVRVDRGAVVYDLLAIDEDGVHYGTIAAWESRSVYNDAERITLIALAVAGLGVIGMAAAIGGTLTRRMLRPVTDVSAIISEIEAADLTERLAWNGPDDELGRLCDTFDRLLDRLETAIERERRFLADASHELRTPLSVMRAEVELALLHERTPEAYRSALVRLRRETQRLEVLAHSLILTTRDAAGALVARTASAADIVMRAQARMAPLATARAVELTADRVERVEVTGDADMLERAIVALIDNALRFANRIVTLSVCADGSNAVFTVRDDGPGFSDAALRDATNRFWRDDQARSGEGTGLGLAIARSIVERHDGTIVLRNAPGGAGAMVELTMPAAQAVPH